MVFKKRISCIVLSVLLAFAVCAPCALGVFANDVDTFSSSTSLPYVEPIVESTRSITRSGESNTLHNHASRAEQYSVLGWSVDPDYFFYDAGSLLCHISSNNYYKTYDGPCIAVLVTGTYGGRNFSQPYLTTPSTDITTNKRNTAFYRGNRVDASEYSTFTIESNDYFVTTGIGFSSGYSSTNIPIVPWTSQSRLEIVTSSLLRSGFSILQPPPPPAEDGWTYGTTDLYFTNISDSSFVFNQLNYPFSIFPSKDIIVDDSPSKIIVGAFWDNTDWLSSGSTISGQLQVQFTSPLTSVDNFIQRGFIWFVNGSDPSLTGFQYYEVPTSWEYIFTVWKYGVNQWTNEYIFNFQFTLPEDLNTAIGFTPVNILIGLYGLLPVGSFSTECWYNVQNLVFGYYIPPSSGDPEVPPTPVFNNPDNTSTVINPSEPTVVDNLNEELGFYDNVWKSYNLTSDTFIDFFEEVIGFGATNLDEALGRLYHSFSYSGSGSIYLPSATIPFGDSELHLWDQTEIPLAYWFSNLPSQIKVVFGFIIVFSVASACWGIAFFFIRKIVSGNYQSSDF